MRRFGKGIDQSFGVAGGALALVGCVAGNLLTVVIVVARQEEMAILDVLSRLNPSIAVRLLAATFSPIDVLFYGLAIYFGYKYSFRRVSAGDLASLAL